MNEGGLEIANAKYPGFDLHVDVDLELVEWNPAVLEREEYAFMSCNLETRAEQYVGTCVKPEDVTTPLLTNPGTGAIEVYLQQPRYQRLCDAICYCSEELRRIRTVESDLRRDATCSRGPATTARAKCASAWSSLTTSSTRPTTPASPVVAFSRNRNPGRPGIGRRLIARTGTRADRRVAVPGPVSVAAVCYSPRRTSTISSPRCRTCRRDRSNLDTKVDSVRTAQAVANQEAQQHHADTSLETIIRAGFDDLKRGTDSLSSSLDEILAKQQQALAAAQESLQIQERTNALAEAGLRQIEKLARAVEKQTQSIHAAYASNAFTGVEQYVAVQENAVVTRERKAKENMLMNQPCQMKVMYYSFELDNFNNTGASDCLSRALRGTQQPRRGGNAGVRRTQESHRVPVESVRGYRSDVQRRARHLVLRDRSRVQARHAAVQRRLRQLRDHHQGVQLLGLRKRGRGHLRHVQR